jgi:hypothetical protein
MSAIPTTAAPTANLITNPPKGEFDAIYEAYDKSLVSERYYASRLTFYRQINKVYEIVLAIGTSAAIAGWAVFQENPGKTFWAIFSGIVTILVILKPILQIPQDIEYFTNLHTGYRALVVNLRAIVTKIKRQEGLTPQMVEIFDATQKQYEGLSLKEETKPNRKVLDKYKREVAEEIRASDLWYPPASLATAISP